MSALDPRGVSTQALASIVDPRVIADPYPAYRALRDADPVHHDETIPGGAWILTRYSDVTTLLKDPRLSSDRMPLFRLVLRDTDEARAFDDSVARWLLNLEPPRHTRLRALVSKAFTPHIVEQLRPRMQEITDGLLDAAQPGKHISSATGSAPSSSTRTSSRSCGPIQRSRLRRSRSSCATTPVFNS